MTTPAVEGGNLPDDLLMSLYGALAGFNDMPVQVLEGTRDEMRGRYAQEIVARGLFDNGCRCEVCEAVRADAVLMGLDK